jgi:hypothetical protein
MIEQSDGDNKRDIPSHVRIDQVQGFLFFIGGELFLKIAEYCKSTLQCFFAVDFICSARASSWP